ncbi:MAG TPA: formylglycine-generating enzyme family protein [Planctomycetota bacterium]|nr:formylglycine-generating enzyme family protein [Planctomycetota bacterium]
MAALVKTAVSAALLLLLFAGCGSSSPQGFAFDPRQTSAATQLGVPVETTLATPAGVKIQLALIPAGTFTPRPRKDQPDTTVTIEKPFYMSRHEITQAQYAIVMDTNPSTFAAADSPVEQMKWADAVAFCTKLSEQSGKRVRLPTEMEWEYACRAGSSGAYYAGTGDNILDQLAWFKGNCDKTHPVGKKAPNAWGLYDTLGNVAEWCADVIPAARDGEESIRVSRGGSWLDEPVACRTGSRALAPESFKTSKIGFRILVELK